MIDKLRVERAHKYLPDQVKSTHHPNHLLMKTEKEEDVHYICSICLKNGNGWSYQCKDDGFEIHPQCAFRDHYYTKLMEEAKRELRKEDKLKTKIISSHKLPDQFETAAHSHTLSKQANSEHKTYGCSICHTIGNDVHYECEPCKFFAHPACIIANYKELVLDETCRRCPKCNSRLQASQIDCVRCAHASSKSEYRKSTTSSPKVDSTSSPSSPAPTLVKGECPKCHKKTDKPSFCQECIDSYQRKTGEVFDGKVRQCPKCNQFGLSRNSCDSCGFAVKSKRSPKKKI